MNYCKTNAGKNQGLSTLKFRFFGVSRSGLIFVKKINDKKMRILQIRIFHILNFQFPFPGQSRASSARAPSSSAPATPELMPSAGGTI